MFVSRNALFAVKFILRLGCLMFLPFQWDSRNDCLKLSRRYRLTIFYVYFAGHFFVWLNMSIRFLFSFIMNGAHHMNGPVVVTNAIWILATTITFISLIQVHVKKESVIYTINTILGYMKSCHESKTLHCAVIYALNAEYIIKLT